MSAGLQWTQEPRAVRGSGYHEGRPPAGAGIIAMCHIEKSRQVCICVTEAGRISFPEGPLKDSETVMEGALREWTEETSISLRRFHLLRKSSIDDAVIGFRYLLAKCDPPDRGSVEPDVEYTVWAPFVDDPSDTDPIVECRWCPVSVILSGRTNFEGHRVLTLKIARDILEDGCDFVPVWPRKRGL